ncbi:hypothetical protein [Rhodobacter capsulatus]|uniref:hypothetical protein n=1 Tax=Rhodobacter capsulatus TaxID=1061 RepID=UPI00103E19F1|nr:hypothetical protein [Rhodobacter capsulatus]
MRKWKIEEYDSDELKGTYWAPGNLSETEVSSIMKQLAARHLQPDEIICANLRQRSSERTELLHVRNSSGVLQVGQSPFLVAKKIDVK